MGLGFRANMTGEAATRTNRGEVRRRRRGPASPSDPFGEKVGRNDPCPSAAARSINSVTAGSLRSHSAGFSSWYPSRRRIS